MTIGIAFAAVMVIGNGPCDSRPCQHDGQCMEVTVPQPGSGHRHLQQADHRCSMADMVQLLETVDAQCCASEDDDCSTGTPTKCSAACAAVFLSLWDRCGSLFDEQTYAHFVADCQSVPRAEPCSAAAVVNQTTAINRECCGPADERCEKGGVPTSCDTGCADAFLPFWDQCFAMFDVQTYGPVVALCQHPIRELSFSCMCTSGWAGETCDTPIDNCNGADCGVHGVCESISNGYVCHCPPGASGTHCEQDSCRHLLDGKSYQYDVDPCMHGTCNGAGQCECVDDLISNSIPGVPVECPLCFYGQSMPRWSGASCNVDNFGDKYCEENGRYGTVPCTVPFVPPPPPPPLPPPHCCSQCNCAIWCRNMGGGFPENPGKNCSYYNCPNPACDNIAMGRGGALSCITDC